MRSDHVLCLSARGFHRMHYTDWGSAASGRVVICVHGLSRNCRDFDFLAEALQDECRVACPDVAGRGRSDWLRDKHDYASPQYLADMNALLARITAPVQFSGEGASPRDGPPSICWVGTSMGGLLGMLLAALPGSPIRRLVINDAGPLIPRASLERIGGYLGTDPRFATLAEMETHVRTISASFGTLTNAQWHHLTLHGARQYEDGSWGFRYDPGIAVPYRAGALQDVDLWSYWDAVTCPTLVLRGAESDFLLRETADQMRKRGPRAQVVEFAGVGHAPALMSDDQIRVVRDFLLRA